jgi:small subunit ribosomal protein S13
MDDKQKIKDKAVKSDQDKKKEKPKYEPKEEIHEVLVRIMGRDIPGSKKIFVGLTRIKGISWAISNAACLKLAIPRSKKIQDLSKEDINKIENFLKKIDVYDFLKNRRKDQESGGTTHYFGSDLDIKKEFDIKRLKEIKSYKGIRHAAKLPVRGQRTKSHFRKKGVAIGVNKKKNKT